MQNSYTYALFHIIVPVYGVRREIYMYFHWIYNIYVPTYNTWTRPVSRVIHILYNIIGFGREDGSCGVVGEERTSNQTYIISYLTYTHITRNEGEKYWIVGQSRERIFIRIKIVINFTSHKAYTNQYFILL